MTIRFLMPLLMTAIVAVSAPDGRADSASGAQLDKEVVGKIVREYLLENPEVLEEAFQRLEAKREAQKQERIRIALRKHDKALRSHPMSPVSGNPEGDVTLVEFFDYQCGYCKRSLEPMKALLKADRQLRVVWKEFPILGPISRFAARAAAAAHRQDLYLDFHVALMGASERLNEERILSIASRTGLDVQRLREDMQDPAIEEYLDETYRLAEELGISGTPAFVIGDTVVPGAVGEDALRQLIAKARSG